MGLKNFTPSLDELLRTEVDRAIASDLPSDVLAHAPRGALLVTPQTHLNVVAVAARGGLPAVLLTRGMRPDRDLIDRARAERVVLLGTERTSFDTSGLLYGVGLRGEPV